MNQKDLYEQQLDIEASEVEAGADRYMNLLTIKGHAETTVGRRVIAGYVDAYAEGIRAYLHDSLEAKRRGRRAQHAVLMRGIDPVSMSMIALRTVFQAVSEGMTITAISNTIGSLLVEHCHWQNMKSGKDTRKLARKVEKQVAKVSAESHRRAVVRHVTHSYLPPELTVDWAKGDMIKVGLTLLEIMQDTTGLITMPNVRKGKKFEKRLELTPFAMEMLEDGHSRAAVLKPVYSPMVVPPRDWTTTTSGGYLTRNQWFIKNRNMAYQARIKEDNLDAVFASVNTLQRTGYQINRGVLAVAKEAMAANMQIAGLPDREKTNVKVDVPKPHDIDTNEEALKEWKRRARMAYDAEAKRVSRQISADRCVSIASKYAEHDALYFPMFLDWRGRVYPMPVDLQPQGSDLAKALLRFSEGKRLGAEGVAWLKIHVANCFGVDKVSLVERIKWTDEHMDQLLDSAALPFDGQQFWLEADAKTTWQALAACYELMGVAIQGEDYVSHLPVGVDGSCNGLQNLSALLLDEQGGTATNLVPADKPQDIYTQVMDRTVEKLTAISYNKHYANDEDHDWEMARRWIDVGLNRKLVKRPVMTKPYGVTAFGMRDQMIGEMHKQKMFTDDQEAFRMATWVAPLVEESINELVIASKLVMDWLQQTAKAAAEHNLPLSWVTPVGLRVLQDHRKMSSVNEEVFVGGQRKQFKLAKHTDQVDKRKQISGMSPNVIHSMDASHMMMTINSAVEEGIVDFSMVHDNYATHACNVPLLNAVLREAFVEMYSADVLGGLREQFVSQVEPSIGETFPEVPAKGSLDLSQVLESDYFFA